MMKVIQLLREILAVLKQIAENTTPTAVAAPSSKTTAKK